MVHRDAADVEIFVIARIDAQATEVHRARVEAVDALPGFAAIRGFVDAAVFEAIGALLVLHVFHLAAEHRGRWARGGGSGSGKLRAIGESDGNLATLFAAREFEFELVPGFVRAQDVDHLRVGIDALFGDRGDEVAGLQPRFSGRSIFDDVREPHAPFGVFAHQPGVRARSSPPTTTAATTASLPSAATTTAAKS